jgi:hypothetical protein
MFLLERGSQLRGAVIVIDRLLTRDGNSSRTSLFPTDK